MATFEEPRRKRAVTFQSGVRRKFKFLSAREFTNHDCVFDLKPSLSAQAIACSKTHWALPYQAGGGGPVFVSAIDAVGKVEPATALERCVLGHKAAVHAVAFSPFHDGLLATAADDCRVMLFDVASDSKEGADVGTHASGARCLAFHPSAEHVLLSADGGECKVWDVETRKELAAATVDKVHAVDWARDGSQFLASCRDKSLKCLDARTGKAAWACEPHGGSRAFKALWAGGSRIGDDYVVSAGGAAAGGREVCLLDPRKPSEPLFRKHHDSQTGEMLPHWDEDAAVLWCWGRGDTTARWYEVDPSQSTASEALHPGADWRTASQAGPAAAVCAVPKQLCDVMDLEVAKFLRLTSSTVERVQFHVSRTSELKQFFNDDIFAETRARVSSVDASSWAGGEDCDPVLEPLRPAGAPLLSERVVEEKKLHTAVVNERRATEAEHRAQDDATMDRLSKLANQYEQFNVNRSMGMKPGVDAACVDGGEVDSDEWDD
mmetsp:Transcript_12285/g.36525  ORF Transcript_12285/g.36525 Transcript_12285/m.36525 type:complete len:491 (-) Transcript_12285:23-1495(-)